MYNSTYLPHALKENVSPPVSSPVVLKKANKPTVMTVCVENGKIVLSVDRQNERFTYHYLTEKKHNSVSMYAMKLIAHGWRCFPTHGFTGWMVVSPERWEVETR